MRAFLFLKAQSRSVKAALLVKKVYTLCFTGFLSDKNSLKWVKRVNVIIMDIDAAEQLFLACDKDRDGYISRFVWLPLIYIK